MQVMCITDRWNYYKRKLPSYVKYPQFGEICTVCEKIADKDGPYYRLKEYKLFIYPQNAFIPLLGESEEQREKLKEVNLSKSFEKLKNVL